MAIVHRVTPDLSDLTAGVRPIVDRKVAALLLPRRVQTQAAVPLTRIIPSPFWPLLS
jgi:hypothetical protein